MTPLQSLKQFEIIAALLLKCCVWQAAICGRIPDNRVNCSPHLIIPSSKCCALCRLEMRCKFTQGLVNLVNGMLLSL